MKKFSLIAILLIAVMMIVGCSHNAEVSKNADERENVSFSANNAENYNSKIVEESERSTQISTTETTTAQSTSKPKKTEKSTTAPTTSAKPAEQKSAGQVTTQKVTTTQKSTTAERQTTTKKVTTTQKPTTTTEKAFDVSYWVSYAKDYARSVGLEVNSSASDCWDNPISANSKCKYLERDIKGMLNRYAKDEDVTQVWIWAEKTSADSYNIYIGYA